MVGLSHEFSIYDSWYAIHRRMQLTTFTWLMLMPVVVSNANSWWPYLWGMCRVTPRYLTVVANLLCFLSVVL